MLNFKDINLDLGIPKLIPEWRSFFSKKDLFADAIAGTTVAFVAIPLSLAIALASGASPGVGLITSIVAGIICAFFGGTSLAVSGPAAAMSILVADIIQKHGIHSLVLICAIAGLMQLISGILGIGKIARYVPLPVIAGFTAGIGVIIIIGQLPRAFGFQPPAELTIYSVFNHLQEYMHHINGACIFLVAMTMGIIYGLPKILPKVPSILPAVIITTCIAYIFDLSDVPLIGAIPSSLPLPELPQSTDIAWKDLLVSSFIIYLLASLETLLSSSAVDKITKGKKHNSNQELIGQGLGNMAVSLFGGIPITGVIARSATNVRAGAKTRRASIIHSFIILLAIFVAAPFISAIPIAALAGVLFTVAFSMISYKEFYEYWITSRTEAIIYTITFLTIIFVDFIAGVQAGIATACLLALLRTTKTHLHVTFDSSEDVTRLSLIGALSFLSVGKISDLQKEFADKKPGQIILMDLASIRNLDMSGATAIVELFHYCRAKHINFYIKGLPRRFESIFKACGGTTLLQDWHLVTEQELRKKGEGATSSKSAHGRLIHGIQRFYVQNKHDDRGLYESISKEQDPHTLFITCSDSRIVPSLITSSDPGELFIIRNIGNFIPPYNPHVQFSESAALEFALSNFAISDIVICGHINCGAMQACQALDKPLPPMISGWIKMIRAQLKISNNLTEMACANVVNQINNLKQYPIIQKKLAADSLKIHGWFFDFGKSVVYELNQESNDFVSIIPAENVGGASA